ncbi:P-selectin glycoprotein ligand 1 [Trichomycterus rosablanca]|uniref:P-selectin glycoprotein ligand 1 n=1 Tax=Trichomycterus rosablanca TaxID=2290929 RepID=UPI002F35F037
MSRSTRKRRPEARHVVFTIMAQTNRSELSFLLLILLTTPSLVSCEGLTNTTTPDSPKQSEVPQNSTTPQKGNGTEAKAPAAPTPQENGTLGDLHPKNETVPTKNRTEVSPAGPGGTSSTESLTRSTPPAIRSTIGFESTSLAGTFPVSVNPENQTEPVVRPTAPPTPKTAPTRTPKTTAPPTPKTTPTRTTKKATQPPPCPTSEPRQEGLVGGCLIAIAVLATAATVFIVATVVLATKLAGARYRIKAGLLDDTEMVCISALVNDSDHPMAQPRHPKSNGALIPVPDDDDGDDLTLNSFLPDNESAS